MDTLESIDDIENYDCEIDSLELEHEEFFRDFIGHEDVVKSGAERESLYPGLVKFLNTCLTTCRSALGKKADGSYYRELRFFVWDKEMGDGIDGSRPLKADLAGILSSSSRMPNKVFWMPSVEREQIIIPVEVNSDSKELVFQAGPHARHLFSASPLHQFTLVLGYEHTNHRLRFLAYHRGGLTASHDLDPFTPEGREGILRLFLSLLTWKSPADAGYPLCSNEASIFIPMQINESDHFIRGRSPRVLRVKKQNTVTPSSGLYPAESLGSGVKPTMDDSQ